MRKSVLSIALAIALCLGVFVGVPMPGGVVATSVSGTPSAWASEQVGAAVAAGLVPAEMQSAYTQAVTRAEFAALAVAFYETETGVEIADRVSFSDTDGVNVEKAAAIGVVEGIGGNVFDPDARLTREQAALMLSRLADAIGSPLTGHGQGADFADETEISDWAYGAVRQVRAAGIMGGVGANMFAPQEPYTREQSIVTIMRLRNGGEIDEASNSGGYGEDAAGIYYQFIQEQLAPELGLPSLEKIEATIQAWDDNWFSLSGILSAYISDLDQNNGEELLLFYLRESGESDASISMSAYTLYAEVYTLNNGVPTKADEMPLAAYHEARDSFPDTILLASNQWTEDNLFVSSVIANSNRYIIVEYSLAGMNFADGFSCDYWALEFEDGKLSIPFSFTQTAGGSSGFEYTGYEIVDGKIQSEELLYSDGESGSIGKYGSFNEALTAFFGRFGIPVSYKDRTTSILNDGAIEQRILTYYVNGVDGDYESSTYKYEFQATDHTNLRSLVSSKGGV